MFETPPTVISPPVIVPDVILSADRSFIFAVVIVASAIRAFVI